jgi:hypothetical protein
VKQSSSRNASIFLKTSQGTGSGQADSGFVKNGDTVRVSGGDIDLTEHPGFFVCWIILPLEFLCLLDYPSIGVLCHLHRFNVTTSISPPGSADRE